MENNYVSIHTHTYNSLLDSATPFEKMVDRAVELKQKAIAFTEHGNTYYWFKKRIYCEKKGIKFIFGAELYMTQGFKKNKIKDNYHILLLAKNDEGIKEINHLIDISTDDDHKYFKNRITIEEFLNISDNVIKTSACLGGFLWQAPIVVNSFKEELKDIDDSIKAINANINSLIIKGIEDNPSNKKKYDKLIKEKQELLEKKEILIENIQYLKNNFETVLEKFDYLEIQPHYASEEQKSYNKQLLKYAKKYNKPLVVGTDAHSSSRYMNECREVIMRGKDKDYPEDGFDLVYKSYDEVVKCFEKQGVVPEEEYLRALENTNKIADMVSYKEIDYSFKYPDIPGVKNEKETLKLRLNKMYKEKRNAGILVKGKEKEYLKNIREELDVFEKIGMIGFILFMSNLISWCRENNIPVGPCRGSVGGSTIAYISDIIDLDPVRWHTIFSRFANKYRKELGDIDVDISPDQRAIVYQHIIDSFGIDHTAYVLSFGTTDDKSEIDVIAKSFAYKWVDENITSKDDDAKTKRKNRQLYCNDERNPYNLSNVKEMKKLFVDDIAQFKVKYKEIDYFMKGLKGCLVSHGIHPAGMIVAPSKINLPRDFGCMWGQNTDGEKIRVISCDMSECHDNELVKYDILGLKNIQIIRDTCKYAGLRYPRSFEIDWEDQKVWKHMKDSPVGFFQFESPFAYSGITRYNPHKISDLTLVNAALRPSGASYRDDLFAGKFHTNATKQMDEILADNKGFLVYQEDTIRLLQEVCGLDGSDADNIRRAIGHKDNAYIEKRLPDILDGYCKLSNKPRKDAEQEAKEMLQVIKDSAAYQFGMNHSTGYSMIGYMCILLRTYFPAEFISAYLNATNKTEDIIAGTELMNTLDISYLNEKEYIDAKKEIINKLSFNKDIEIKKADKKIEVYPMKFGKSKSYYTNDGFQIYTGIASIKGMNDVVANQLYDLAQKDVYANADYSKGFNFPLFYDLIKDIETNTDLKKNQFEALIRLNFFSMFGKNKSLFNIYSSVQQITNRLQYNKKQLALFDVNEEIFKKYVGEETNTLFKKIDYNGYYHEYLKTYPNEAFDIIEQIGFENKYLGKIQTNEYKGKPLYFVSQFKTYSNKNLPYVTITNLKTKENIYGKITKKDFFALHPFSNGDILTGVEYTEVFKKKKTPDGKFIDTDEKMAVFEHWNKIDL